MFTLKELAKHCGISCRTMHRRLAELKQEKKFKKESRGYFYSLDEAKQLAQLLKFKLPGIN